MRTKVFVFELNSYNTHLLPMYRNVLPVLFNDDQLSVQLFTLSSVKKRTQSFINANVSPLDRPSLKYFLPTKTMRGLYYRHAIQRLINHQKPDAIVFNTLEPKPYLDVFKAINHPIKIGLLHNPSRLKSDYNAKSKNELLFCLFDYNYARLKQAGLKIDGYFSPFHKCIETTSINREVDRIEIAVQGIISYSRRNYPFLIELAKAISLRHTSCNIIFNILTNATHRDGPHFKETIKNKHLQNFFRFHKKLSDVDFFNQLANASYVMPLLNHRTGTYSLGKATSAYMHSGAYRVPLILDNKTAETWSISDNASIVYNSADNLVELLTAKTQEPDSLSKEYGRLIDRQIDSNYEFLRNLFKAHVIFKTIRTSNK
jgi:hypothetical protein